MGDWIFLQMHKLRQRLRMSCIMLCSHYLVRLRYGTHHYKDVSS